MVRGADYGQSWDVVDFEWEPLLDGAANVSDLFTTIYRGIVYTGIDGLAGIRIQHPAAAGEPRSFQLFKSRDLGAAGSWYDRSGMGTGGLPEVHYLGRNRFGFTAILEGYPGGWGNEGGDFLFDSIMMRTDDGGETYYQLADFYAECGDPEDPDNKVTTCVQYIEYLGDDRLLGWTRLKAASLADYPNGVPFYLSHDGGMNWSLAGDLPFDPACESLPFWEGAVEDLIYVGKTGEGEDILVAQTHCWEVFEAPSPEQGVEYGPITGKSLFYTRNSGRTWVNVTLPPQYNKDTVFLYAGDNGAIPALYTR
jgi:hypothetical protein